MSSHEQHDEQAILIYLKLADDVFGVPEDRETLYALEDEITDVLETKVTVQGVRPIVEFCTDGWWTIGHPAPHLLAYTQVS